MQLTSPQGKSQTSVHFHKHKTKSTLEPQLAGQEETTSNQASTPPLCLEMEQESTGHVLQWFKDER